MEAAPVWAHLQKRLVYSGWATSHTCVWMKNHANAILAQSCLHLRSKLEAGSAVSKNSTSNIDLFTPTEKITTIVSLFPNVVLGTLRPTSRFYLRHGTSVKHYVRHISFVTQGLSFCSYWRQFL
jgi:hypothetical protein